MNIKAAYDIEHVSSTSKIDHELWPLDEINPKAARFPCCLVWTPLPVVSWLAPFIGHVGICREDGVSLDFSGSNLVNVDEFAVGAVARYLQLDRKQVHIFCIMFVPKFTLLCFIFLFSPTLVSLKYTQNLSFHYHYYQYLFLARDLGFSCFCQMNLFRC